MAVSKEHGPKKLQKLGGIMIMPLQWILPAGGEGLPNVIFTYGLKLLVSQEPLEKSAEAGMLDHKAT